MLKLLYCGEDTECSRLGLIPTSLTSSRIPTLPSSTVCTHLSLPYPPPLYVHTSPYTVYTIQWPLIALYSIVHTYIMVRVCSTVLSLWCVCTYHTHICIETSNFSCVYACVCSRHVSQWRRLVSVVPVRSPVCSCSHPETALLPLVYWTTVVSIYHWLSVVVPIESGHEDNEVDGEDGNPAMIAGIITRENAGHFWRAGASTQYCTSNASLFPTCTFERWRLGRGTASVRHRRVQRMPSNGGEFSRWLDRSAHISRGAVCKNVLKCFVFFGPPHVFTFTKKQAKRQNEQQQQQKKKKERHKGGSGHAVHEFGPCALTRRTDVYKYVKSRCSYH